MPHDKVSALTENVPIIKHVIKCAVPLNLPNIQYKTYN